MQSALNIASPPLPNFPPPSTTTKSLTLTMPRISVPRLHSPRYSPVKASSAPENSTVDYSSTTSVFPAEACDIVGGKACNVQMYPEVKLQPETTKTTKAPTDSEQIEREYLEYDSPKTVFPGEACDDLGGEFCEPDYQQGVF